MNGFLRWTLVLCLVALPALADGPDTGTVTGTVVDAGTTPLPGVTVNLVGERGTQTVITGPDGIFRFASIVGGDYTIEAELEGFATAEQMVVVTVGKRSEFTMILGMSTEETITVTSEAPMVDKYNVTAGATVAGDTAGEIAGTVRSFYGAMQVLPGVTNDRESSDLSQSRPSVNGSLWQEGNVYVDGVDATYSMQGGGTRVFLPSSALAEVSMEAGGGGAEYGRNSGSHTNLITKSGTNRFHGDFAGVIANNSWNTNYDPQPTLADDQRFVNTFINKGLNQQEAEVAAANWVVYKPGDRDGSDTTIEASLGGPIKRDKAWFFVSYGEVTTNQVDKTLDGTDFNVSSELFAAIAKFNFQPSPKHSIAASFIDAPVDRIFLLPQMGDKYVASFFEIGGSVASVSWNYSVSSNLFMEFKLAQQVSDENPQPVFSTEDKFQDPSFTPNPALGKFAPVNNGAIYAQTFDDSWHNGWVIGRGYGENNFPRNQLNLALTQFVGTNHELKYGLDLQEVEWKQDVSRDDAYRVYELDLTNRFGAANNCKGVSSDPNNGGDDTRCFWVDYHPPDMVAAGKGSSDSTGDNFAFYVRDRFSIGDHWTFNVGARLENQTLTNDVGRDVIDSNSVSPRFTAVYDLGGDGKKLLSLAGGRFFTQTPQQLVNSNLQETWNGVNAWDTWMNGSSITPALASFPAEVACAILPAFGVPIDNTNGPYCLSLGSVRPGEMWGFVDQGLIDVDIEPYHRDEIVLGYEWQYSRNWALIAQGIYWRLDNLIGSTQQRGPDGDIFLLVENYPDYANILRSLNWVENFVANSLGTAEQANSILDNFEDDNREYKGLQFQLNRRFANGWSLYNNITLSEVEGRTYGGGDGNSGIGAFDNLNDDYGRNLEVVLTEGAIAGVDCSAAGLPSNCQDQLRQFIGQPLSTVNRFGPMPINRPVIFKSYGYKVWNLGSQGGQSITLGGNFTYQSGSPWERNRGLSYPTCSATVGQPCLALADVALGTTINTFLQPRGSIDNSDFWWLNLSTAYALPVSANLNLNLRLEVTNVTNEQEQVDTFGRTGAPLRSRRFFQQPRKFRVVVSLNF